jgi:hypothetical protein
MVFIKLWGMMRGEDNYGIPALRKNYKKLSQE